MKPNFRPLSSPPAGLQREKTHCPRKALLSFQWWVKTRLFLIDTTCGGVFCGWIPTAVPPAGPSPPPNALHQLIFQRQPGGEHSFLLSDRPPPRTHRLYKVQACVGSRVVVQLLGGHFLIRPPRSGEVCGRRESSVGRRKGGYGWSPCMKLGGEWGHRGTVPEQGGPDTGQGNLKQHKILREHQDFASNALVRHHDILRTLLQGCDLFSLSVLV